MGAALALAERARGLSAPNPNVGCVLVRGNRVVGRGWTGAGGRPHAEAVALGQAGAAARGATAYVTLEPCAHRSPRGPACADLLIVAGVAHVVVALTDPDPRTDGEGLARLRAAGVEVTDDVRVHDARRVMAPWLTRQMLARPFVTLKLATSLDGCIALADGSSRWITGDAARAHAHLERARHEAILVGRGTWEADRPALDIRLPGLEDRSPARYVLSGQEELEEPTSTSSREATGGGPFRLQSPEAIATLPHDSLLVEGGARTAAAFLRAGLVDRLLLYRAPILIGAGRASLGDIGLDDLADAHDRWTLTDERRFGSDRLEVYECAKTSGLGVMDAETSSA